MTIEFSNRVTEALANMDLDNPDRTLTNVSLECCWGPITDRNTGVQVNKGGFSFDWMSKSAGCGRVTFYKTNEGELRCYNQDESKEFIQKVFAKFLESVTLDS